MIKGGSTKGLSTIVATLLIILLTLVAVGLVWVVVRTVIQENSEKILLGRLTVDLDITQADIINDTSISVTVKRNPGRGEVSGIIFVVYDKDNSEIARYNISMRELEERNFQIILFVVNTSKIKKVSIAPIFMLKSGKEFIGDIEDEWIFSEDVATGCTSSLQCNDANICTTDTCSEGACSHTSIILCTNNDGCCPAGCTSANDNDCPSSPPSPVPNYWTGELLLNGGFELGTLNYWATPLGPEWAVANVLPQAGSYAVYYQASSNINYYIIYFNIYPDLDLTNWAGQIDAGDARINASGWGRSLEYPNHDLTRIQFIFLDSAKNTISTALDTGYVSNGIWWKAEVSNYEVPAGTRSLRVWANTYDPDGSTSGSIDSFSVMLGYF